MHVVKQQQNLIRFIKRLRHDVIDYYQDSYIFDGTYIGPRGVVVACNQTTFDRIVAHAERYCPEMVITSMTVEECMNRRNNYD